MIPYSRQSINEEDIDAVVKVLRSDFLTQGLAVPSFEKALEEFCGARHAVVVSSATAGLHVTCLALGLGRGDYLWTVPNSFVASANCARYCDAEIDFVDIDPDTYNISVSRLAEKLRLAKVAGRLPKIVVPVDFAGHPVDQVAIWELGKEFGFKIIEDASHAIGAVVAGEPVGSCKWSDAAVFSFHPVKNITTGEGGAVMVNDQTLADRIRLLRSHGITRNPDNFQIKSNVNGWCYEQQLLGFNYRMTEFQAALGESQLRRLDGFIQAKERRANIYNDALRDLPLALPVITLEPRSAWHLYVVRVPDSPRYGGRSEIYNKMRAKNIGVNVHYTPIHLQPYYRSLGFSEGMFPEAERHGVEALSLPLYPELSSDMQEFVVATLREIFQ
jgi:UDP-4-amino-4,6-dideoxy-N-acetyl-beta-L-altrosamine transaminase